MFLSWVEWWTGRWVTEGDIELLTIILVEYQFDCGWVIPANDYICIHPKGFSGRCGDGDVVSVGTEFEYQRHGYILNTRKEGEWW